MAANLEAWAIHLALAAAAALVSAVLIVALRPLLSRYALARPNARSSHKQPTPQGGGIAVIAAMTVVTTGALILFPRLLDDPHRFAGLAAAVLALALVGVTDDIRPLEALPRLILQAAAVALVLAMLPAELRVLPQLPWWLERAGLLIGGIWFVNLTNFMDGIDWITVAEVVPITAALAAFGLAGALPPGATLVSFALCGAMLGFAPFNKPVARLFLGDVGSLPIGLTLTWLLILFSGNGHLIAAFLLPLYYVADATVTLLRRLATGEKVMQAHRSHFYQRAIDRGFSVPQIVARVFIVNVALCTLAAIALVSQTASLHWAALAIGSALVAALLWNFAKGPRAKA
jgi:UDP-N-acetylmuramyl pentapeptide phosphotransferase/UDP-N-acetylglucosamine-1-phosphate transferase